MTPPRHHGPARDHNERPIAGALRGAGLLVSRKLDFDLVAFCPDCGGAIFVEVKNADGRDKITPTQQALLDFGVRLEIVYDSGEIPALVTQHRAEFCTRRNP